MVKEIQGAWPVLVGRAQQPLVAIVGRPNVGKSSLFNRLMGRRLAIVAGQPGTTRDRISSEVTWGDRTFLVVDTGGLEVHPESPLGEKVTAQVEAAIQEADVVVFLTDVTQGVMPGDWDIAERLRRADKRVVVAPNKADNPRQELAALEHYALGLGDPAPISAYHNTGIDDLLVRVFEDLPRVAELPPPESDTVHVAIVGRTNVGKSMLANAILGQERAIVSETPGTTRDALDTPLLYKEHPVLLIDTAGIRRRGRIQPGVERYSVLRALRAIARSDVTLLVLDATELVTAQDTHVAGQVRDSFKGVVVVVNKWDLAQERGLDQAEVRQHVLGRLRFMDYVPVRFASALRREGVSDIMDTALEVYRERKKEVSRGVLQDTVMRAIAAHPPPRQGPRALRIQRVAQEGVNPPTFVFYVNNPKALHFSYERYLENTLRNAFGFRGSHLKLEFRGRRRSPVSGGHRGKR